MPITGVTETAARHRDSKEAAAAFTGHSGVCVRKDRVGWWQPQQPQVALVQVYVIHLSPNGHNR